jgi:hypothetical protein
MRPAVRLPGMRRAFSPCHPDRARLPHHVVRSASGRRKVRAHHRKIGRARPAAILAPSWIVQEGETCQGQSVSASLTESRVASSLKHRRAASGYCASAMLGGPNRVAALVFHPHSGLPRPAVCMIAGPQPDSESAVDNAADPLPGGPWRIHSPEIARRVAPPLRLLRHSGRSVYARPRVTPLGGQT